MKQLRIVRSISKKGNAVMLNLRGILPEGFLGKVHVELLRLTDDEAIIRLVKEKAG